MKILVKRGERERAKAMTHIYDEDGDRALCGRLVNRNSRTRNGWGVEERPTEEVLASKETCYHCYERHVPAVQVSVAQRMAMEKLADWNATVAAGSK